MRLFTQFCSVAVTFPYALSLQPQQRSVRSIWNLWIQSAESAFVSLWSHTLFSPPQEFCYLIKLYLFGSNQWDYLNEAVCSAVLPDPALLCLWWGPFLGCPAVVPSCLWWIKEVTPCPERFRMTGITSFCVHSSLWSVITAGIEGTTKQQQCLVFLK